MLDPVVKQVNPFFETIFFFSNIYIYIYIYIYTYNSI